MKDLEKRLEQAKKAYIDMFDDYFPNMSISLEKQIEIAETCVKKKKDAYELGYFILDEDHFY